MTRVRADEMKVRSGMKRIPPRVQRQKKKGVEKDVAMYSYRFAGGLSRLARENTIRRTRTRPFLPISKLHPPARGWVTFRSKPSPMRTPSPHHRRDAGCDQPPSTTDLKEREARVTLRLHLHHPRYHRHHRRRRHHHRAEIK